MRVLRAADRRYLWGCGALMLLYTVLLYSAVGLAENREQIIAVTVANYLWPSLTLLFSVPILGWSARRGLLGIGSACGGGGRGADAGSGQFSDGSHRVDQVTARDQLGDAAAVAWGLYSTLGRRWAGSDSTGAMPIFLLATGFALLALLQRDAGAVDLEPAGDRRGPVRSGLPDAAGLHVLGSVPCVEATCGWWCRPAT